MSGFFPPSSGSGSGGLFTLSTVLSSPGPSLSLSGIPATGKWLLVTIGSLESTAAASTDTALFRLNGNSGASQYGAGPAASAIGAATGGFNDSLRWVCPGATINAPGGAQFVITNYAAARQTNLEGRVWQRTALGGTAADFNPTPSACIFLPGGAINSIQLTPLTGPNWNTGGFITVTGY